MTEPLSNYSGNAISYTDLHLSPVALHLGPFDLRWYSLAYLAGIFAGYFCLLRLIREPGAPMARRHVDDLVFYDGIYYGDWSVFPACLLQAEDSLTARLTTFDPHKAVLPQGAT